MVNNQNPYSQLRPELPPCPDDDDPNQKDRQIGNTPIWDLADLLKIAEQGDIETSCVIVTFRAQTDYENLVESGFDLLETLQLLENDGVFKGAYWCKTSPTRDRMGRPRGKGRWIPCDAYSLIAECYNPNNNYRCKGQYYFKMARGLDGRAVLFVSLHP